MEKLTIIRTLTELDNLVSYLSDKDYVAFDTETTGVEKDSNIIGYSVCADIEEAFYVILREWDVTTQTLKELETLPRTEEIMKILSTKNLIMHNGIFDCFMVDNNFKVKLIDALHTDTMVLGHLLNENRSNALKERAVELYGQDSKKEQEIMKESVTKNGGVLTKEKYELYKADADLIAHYGAKDAILTLKLFYNDVPILYEEGLDKFFYEEESMPLLRGPTYDMNVTGLRVDPKRLSNLKATLLAECVEAEAYILNEVGHIIKEKYPGDKKNNAFNINSNQQLAWLLFYKLNNEFVKLTDSGREVSKAIFGKVPYTRYEKSNFIQICLNKKDTIWEEPKDGKPKKVKDPWQYIACDEEVLSNFSDKYKWVKRLLQYKKNKKLLSTYVEGIENKMRYSVVNPTFMQIGTTSGRYSCKDPNFQNLPRDDKRIKSCIVSRPGKVFVGADHSQLEPRVFSSQSGDKRLQASFQEGFDFYSVIGVEVYNKRECSLRKDDDNSFANLYPKERHYSKQFGLAGTYGANAYRLAKITGQSSDEMEIALNNYFESFPEVRKFMLTSHEEAKHHGRVLNLFGRPRRMPLALKILDLYGNVSANDLPYEYRNVLNLAVNHKVQSTAASIMNRGAIKVWNTIKQKSYENSLWNEVKILLQVHDSLIIEGPEELKNDMRAVLQDGMENAVTLPGVKLVAIPFASYDLAGQK